MAEVVNLQEFKNAVAKITERQNPDAPQNSCPVAVQEEARMNAAARAYGSSVYFPDYNS